MLADRGPRPAAVAQPGRTRGGRCRPLGPRHRQCAAGQSRQRGRPGNYTGRPGTRCPAACRVRGLRSAVRCMSGNRQKLKPNKSFTLELGEELHFGGTPCGVRAYLCVALGLQPAPILGSRSSLSPVQRGDELACARPSAVPGAVCPQRAALARGARVVRRSCRPPDTNCASSAVPRRIGFVPPGMASPLPCCLPWANSR